MYWSTISVITCFIEKVHDVIAGQRAGVLSRGSTNIRIFSAGSSSESAEIIRKELCQKQRACNYAYENLTSPG
jgi:hypothetical protein